eukprot:1978337-Rhodomonas_salina.1
MSGTELAYGGIVCSVWWYRVSGTELVYGGNACYGMSGTEPAYGCIMSGTQLAWWYQPMRALRAVRYCASVRWYGLLREV